eukprot:scaffold230104_cov33-Tisochrysis_lutea.AAC.5
MSKVLTCRYVRAATYPAGTAERPSSSSAAVSSLPLAVGETSPNIARLSVASAQHHSWAAAPTAQLSASGARGGRSTSAQNDVGG